MEFVSTFLAGIAFPALPTLAGWLVWLSLLGLLVYAEVRWREYHFTWGNRAWGIFFFLLTLTLFHQYFDPATIFRSSPGLYGLPANAPGTALMVLFAIPWLVGGGLLGPIGAAVLGAFTVSCAAHSIPIQYFRFWNLR